jgi:hypothetical protein
MSYIIVEEGTISFALELGVFIGIIIGWFLVYVLNKYFYMMFKSYMNELDGTDKTEIMNTLNSISKDYEFLAKKTNTTVMKSESNSIIKLIAFLRQRRLS